METQAQIQINDEGKKAFEKLNLILQKASTEEKAFLDKVINALRRNLDYNGEELASIVGIGRSTFFYRLQRLGIKLEEIRKALIYETELKRKEKIYRKEVKRLPPSSFSEFLQREVIQKLIERLQSVKDQRNEFHAQRVLSVFYQYCSTLGIAPEDVVEIAKTDPEKIFEYTTKFLAKLAEEGYEINAKIAELQALQMWLYVQLLPPWVEQSEYKGKYTSAELSLEAREEMIRELIDICLNNKRYDREICKLTLKSWVFLYFTGSRAESLTNFAIEQRIRVTWEKFKEVYGTEEFVVIKTSEKGKKGKKYEWRKLIPAPWSHLIPERNLTKKELEKVRALTRTVLLRLISEHGSKLFNNDTIRYIIGEELESSKKKKKRKQGRVLHIWRHTFAREALRAFGWNTYLVSKLGGWVKESNLRTYGDYDLLSLIQASVEKHQMIFVRDMKKMIEEFLSA